MVKRNEKLSILFTFVVGVFFGMYLYITNFAGLVSKLSTPDEQTVSEFVIVADAYGSCDKACPSFQVQHDGSFRYLYTPSAGAEQVLRKGTLPVALEKKLHQVITSQALEEQSAVIEPVYCNSYSDGIDVVYEVTLNGKEYVLDSCGTDIDNESALWSTLGSIWDHFETGGNNS